MFIGNLQFLINAIIQTKVSSGHRQSQVMFAIYFLPPRSIELFYFQIFWLRAYQVKFIPETRRVHKIRFSLQMDKDEK